MQNNHPFDQTAENGPGFAEAPELDSAREAMNQVNERLIQLVREQPVACLVAAVGVGYIAAKIAGRF